LIDHGYDPRASFDWRPLPDPATPTERINHKEAEALAQQIQLAWFAKDNMEQARRKMEAQANRKRREATFQVGDFVWLKTTNWKTNRPSRKLGHQMAGPFNILVQEDHAYRLELPASIQVHPVFSPDRLREAAMDPLPGQVNDPPLPIEVDGEAE
jgi:hypothetical protein